MFVSEHTESHLWGAAQLNYCVVLANGLAELCPDTCALLKCKELKKQQKYWTDVLINACNRIYYLIGFEISINELKDIKVSPLKKWSI